MLQRKIFPFNSLLGEKLPSLYNTDDSSIMQWMDGKDSKKCSKYSLLKPTPNLELW